MSTRAFVLMPFAQEFDEVYDFLIRTPLSDAGYNVTRADNILHQRNILEDVIRGINSADLVVADLSTSNPNVYYELGLAHALAKKVILITQDLEEVPFDLRSYRIVSYSTHFAKMNEAQEEIRNLIASVSRGELRFGSPISDFGVLSGVQRDTENGSRSSENKSTTDDRGLLDYQIELEESIEVLTQVLTEIGERLSQLTPEISTATERMVGPEANFPKKKRKTIRSLAEGLDDYTAWLVGSNGRYKQALGVVGESLNGMLSGEYVIDEEALGQLPKFIETLREVELEAEKSGDQFSGLVAALDSIPKIEREFNRSKNRLSAELKNLIDNIEQTSSVLARARNAATSFLREEN